MQALFQPVRDRRAAPTLVDQTARAIEDAIERRELLPGMALPSVRRFARLHGLSTFTVSAAYARLVSQGWLTSRQGSGYRVASARASAEPVSPGQWVPPRPGASWLLADVFADHSMPIKSGCGWLPASWLDESGLQQSLRQVARTPVNQVAAYGHPYGYYPLREHLQRRLNEQGVPARTDQILLTLGASQALDIVVRTLFRPGDVIVVEEPCYANVLPTFRLAGLKVLGVPRSEEGIDIDALDALARQHPVKAIFVNTVLQNPTGTSLSMHNAFQLLQLAERHDFRVIEDDVSRDLLPGLGPMLLALGGVRRVVHVSGFSKSIMPSMRVGYVVSDAALVQELAKTKMAMGLTTPEIMERAVCQVLRQGRYASYLARVRERLAQAHETLYGLLEENGFEVFARPGAGLFVWARPCGWASQRGAAQVAELALRDGIWLAPGTYFHVGGDDRSWFRFNVAYSGHQALWDFMRRMAAAVQG